MLTLLDKKIFTILIPVVLFIESEFDVDHLRFKI